MINIIKMVDNPFNVIAEFGDSFAIQDISILVPDIEYYFTRTYDKNIYKGKFKEICNKYEKRFIFENVETYDGSRFQNFTKLFSTPDVDKIYHL
jgi:hypothetical protein